MATRVRQSNAAPSQRRPGTELPPYEKPVFPLNKTSERCLTQLTRAHRLDKLDYSLQDAQLKLSKAAGELNDRLYAKEQAQRKRRERNKENENNDGDADAEQSLDQMREKVQSMTQRMDESMRKLIDGQHSVQSVMASVNKAAESTPVDAGTQVTTQPPRSQQIQTSETNGEDGEEEEESEYPDFTPTDPAGATQSQSVPPIDLFRSEMEARSTRYQNHSLTARYAENGSYRDFRRVVHDALFPNEEVPLTHHSEWFNDSAVPIGGATNADGDGDSEDDLAVSRATISTKCPLTLQEFKTPLMSKKCPHTFETDAFNSFFKTSAMRLPTQPGQRGQAAFAVQCPVLGCKQLLYKTDLHVDAVVLRRIRRIQRTREMEEDEADDDNDDGQQRGHTQRRAQIIGEEDDDDDEADPDEMMRDTQANIKAESRGPTASMRSNGA